MRWFKRRWQVVSTYHPPMSFIWTAYRQKPMTIVSTRFYRFWFFAWMRTWPCLFCNPNVMGFETHTIRRL